jgi:hypothetical protein
VQHSESADRRTGPWAAGDNPCHPRRRPLILEHGNDEHLSGR